MHHSDLILILVFSASVVYGQTPKVTGIEPTIGSLAGGTRVTIHGTGFSKDKFAFGDGNEDKGNKVTLTNDDGHSLECVIHVDGCTEIQIMCYTPSGMVRDKPYKVNVKVDGVPVPPENLCADNVNNCKITAKFWTTPTIESITPQSGKPGEIILTNHGRIITTRYGANTIDSTNGRTERILRLYTPQTCNLFKEQDVFYNLTLDSEDPNEFYGTLTCKPEGTFVGNANISILIEAPFGRSSTAMTLYRVSRDGTIYTVQYYTDITSVSPVTGSNEGGALLTVSGSYYETSGPLSTYTAAQVYVGGVKCEVEEVVTDSHLTCRLPAKPASPSLRGNRGVLVESWTSPSFSDYDTALATTQTPSSVDRYDETKYCGTINQKWTRMTGVFVAPYSGKYIFYIKADNGGKLSVGGVTATSSGAWAAATLLTLTAGTEYTIVAVGKAGAVENACVHVKARHMDTQFTHHMTGQAVAERQKLRITSPVVTEKFTMAFSGFSSAASVKEVQQVCLNGGDTKLQLGLYGVYTVPLDFTNAAGMKSELDKLPFLSAGESFTVSHSADLSCAIITFNSERGNIPDFETLPKTGFTITETTKGVSSNTVFALQYNGSPSPLVTFNADGTALAKTLDSALKGLFGTQCPSRFTTGGQFYEGFEAGPSAFSNQATAEVDAFCGRYSLKNKGLMYQSSRGLSAVLYPWLCFAVRDLDNNNLRLKYKNSLNIYKTVWTAFTTMSDGSWNYTCVDLKAVFSDTAYVLVEAQVFGNDPDVDYYIDEIYIGQTSTVGTLSSVTNLRLAPAYPNTNMKTTMENVTVAYDATNANFAVELAPHDCGSDLNLITLASSQLTGSDGANSNTVTSQLLSQSGSLVVTRTSKASKQLTGTLTVAYDGQTSAAIDVQKEDEDFKAILEGMSNMLTLNVERTEASTCANMEIFIEFDDVPGDRPLMTIASSSLSAPAGATAEIVADREGSLAFDPLPGDMVYTLHKTPQVSVNINGVPTMCAMSNFECPYTWSAAATPTITSIDINQGTVGSVLTIAGTLFSSTPSDNTVTIGGVACVVTSSSGTQIVCTVGNGPLNTFPVVVNVKGKGRASGSPNFTYTASLTSITPTTGSLGGNILLTLTGTGFSANSIVKVGLLACPVVSVVEPTTITCTVPSYSDLTVVANQVEQVSVTVGSVPITTTQPFTYVYDSARITSVTPEATLTVHGGQTITITGTNMGATGKVFIAGSELEVMSRSDTQIIVKTPNPIQSGRGLKLLVYKGVTNVILSSSNEIPTVDIALEVTGLFPTKGSLYGGTPLTITGEGFGTDKTAVSVFVDDVECSVTDVSNTKIQCDVADTANIHKINNEGNTGFGVYFAFSEKSLTIEVGDKVQWSWITPEFVNNVQHGVYQTASLTAVDNMVGGVSSGPPSRNGQFVWRFTQEGTFYFWSGYVDQSRIKHYRMTVTVVAPTAWKGSLSVNVVRQEADYKLNSGVSAPVDSSCSALASTDISGCTTETVTDPDASKFTFMFSKCRSPILTSVEFTDAVSGVPRSGTMATQITLRGSGFWTDNCANRVKVGECSCVVSSSAADEIMCSPDPTCKIDIGVLNAVTLNVNQFGNAIASIPSVKEQSIAFVPIITALSPTSGSSRGGTQVTISGSGFDKLEDITVTFNGIGAQCSQVNPLICTSPLQTSSNPGTVAVAVKTKGFDGVCDSSCTFFYDPSITPSISSATPATVTGPTKLAISGTGFGADSAKLSVTVGGQICTDILLTSTTQLTCDVTAVPAGSNKVSLSLEGIGAASGSVTVTGTPLISSVTPNSGSIYGGSSVSFSGHGFTSDTTIKISGADMCSSITIGSLSEVTCVTLPHAAASVTVDLVSNGVSFPSQSFEFSLASTPSITSITPSTGSAGSSVTLVGQNFGSNADEIKVHVGGVECTGVGLSGSDITCTVGLLSSGSHPVVVTVAGKGNSSSTVQFVYQVTVDSITPTSGDELGNQLLTLSGSGFSDAMQVTVCDVECVLESVTSSSYACVTPPGTGTCAVKATDAGVTVTASNQYTYVAAAAPTITLVNPARGGTGGNTAITISGTGFSATISDMTVTIDGVVCTVSSSTTTQIVCNTGAHSGSKMSDVIVSVNGARATSTAGTAKFYYVDVWSSTATWGGGPVPGYDELVSIPKGQIVLLDADTDVLAMLVVEGQLIFDEKDITLKSQRILITNGGTLQVGTVDKPFEHKAVIELYGHHRDEELPIYGTKVLAVRNGTLELHGKPKVKTWSKLASTVAAGATQIQLVDAVADWNVGDQITIASTGGKFSTNENEMRTITAISVDKRTLTLDTALEFKHTGAAETYAGPNGAVTVDFRAEVGLLTRNVVVRGNSDPQWDRTIEKCEAGFNPGEFVTQTCFEGRFGNEKGNSQFGSQIMIHQTVRNTQIAQAHLSFVEVTYGGQAFRLGRYPIHFHLNGDMSKSYVRGCAIHHTFNRAINIHGSENIMIKDNVVYHVMGGALFLEDGIETGNTYEGNLVVMPISSTSLLNEDITPAAFWATNPNNTYLNNAAAGGTHFGYWFRMNPHPDGPSFDSKIFPQRVPLKLFKGNSAHSFGWFGIWTFPDYYPQANGASVGDPVPAKFEDFVSWNNEKGVEFVNFASLQIIRGVFVQNKLAGFEGKRVMNGRKRDIYLSAMIKDTLIVGRTNDASLQNDQNGVTAKGIVLPFGDGIQVHNTKFINFDDANSVAIGFTSIDGTCTDRCGGFNYQVSGLGFENVQNRLLNRWGYESVIEDEDGTLCGSGSFKKIYPDFGESTPTSCDNSCPGVDPRGLPSAVCPSTIKFHRLAFNNISPKSLEGKNLTITNSFGKSIGEYRTKRITHKPGWMVVLVDGETYTLDWENAENMTNVTFNGQVNELQPGDCLIIRMRVTERPDQVSLDGGTTKNTEKDPFTCTTAGLIPGDWFYEGGYVHMALIGVTGRKKRSSPPAALFADDLSLHMQVLKCFFPNCVVPPDPETAPPPTSRPSPYQLWSDVALWEYNATTGLRTASEMSDNNGVPSTGNDVLIPSDKWVVIKEYNVPKLGTVTIEGGLEIDYATAYDYTFEANLIIIIGGRFVVGWQNNPMELGTANIILAGNKNSPMFKGLDGFEIGNKAIGVFGALELNGRDTGSSWARLKQTASAGSTSLTVTDGSLIGKWRPGDKIVITSTSKNPAETEEKTIQSVDASTGIITVTTALSYRHAAGTETVNGKDVLIGAAVGLLTRSIVVQGEVVSGEAHGGRIMASIASVNGNLRTGYVRANNTQFLHMGQDGYTESYDARFALSYMQTGSVKEAKPSIVSGCSFVDLYNSAVGAFGIGELTIENNVVYKPLGNGLVTSSDDTTLDHNLVINLQWTGSYNGRAEAFNIRYEAGIEAFDAKRLILTNNYVSGSQRVGYHVPGEDCTVVSSVYKNNYAAGNLMGVAILPNNILSTSGRTLCTRLGGFILSKNFDFGIYYNNELSLVATDNVYADEETALFPMVIGPSSLDHVCGDKTITVSNSIVIGKSSQSNCALETTPSGTYLILSEKHRSPKGPNGEKLGILFPQFTQGGNNCPEKPCANIMSYNSLCGKMTLEGTTFANFGPGASGCTAGFAIATLQSNDDLQHPLLAKNNVVVNVDQNYKIVLHRPNVGKINPADCVDMDCDALKKALFKDLDGSFMGVVGSVIPHSEWEWGGDPRRGLSDARVPKDMLTRLDGSVISVSQLAPNGKGIVRSASCVFKSFTNFAYYWCPNLAYEMLAIESLDADTETRRLSPVAIASDGYLDLINGPQDHGWCSGYTCQKRLSTFHALVLPGKQVDVYLSSTQPDLLRYFMLNAANDKCIIVSFYYLNPNRIDVYTNDGAVNVRPKNAEATGTVFKLLNEPGVDYHPTCADPHGSNFIDRDARLLFFVIKGSDKIVLKRANVVIVSFGLPTMTEEEFFGSNILENLAAMLNVPLNKVRVVKIVTGSGTRRRRSTGTTAILEIGDEPTATASESTGAVTDYASQVMDSCQSGTINNNLGTTGATCDEVIIDLTTYTPAQPDELRFEQQLTPEHEGVPFSVQPKIRAYDTNGVVIANLGIQESPWQITATLRSCPGCGHANARLTGTLTVTSANGWFNFTDLQISHKGEGYIIDFEITSPASATSMNVTLETAPFSVDALPMTTGIYSMTSGDIQQGATFALTLDLRDSSTNQPIPDITWRGHTAFDATCGLVVSSETGNLTGSLSQSFDMSTGRAAFTLSYSGYGLIYISCLVSSTPAEYEFYSFTKVFVIGSHQANIPSEASQNVVLRYNLDYDTTLPTEAAAAQLHQATLEHFIAKYMYVIIRTSTISKGSIKITFTMEGGSTNVTSALNTICSEISDGLKVTVGLQTLTLDGYMTVDGSDYYANCGKTEDDENGLHPGYIALIVVLAVLLVAIVVFAVVYKLKIKPKSKTHDNGRTVFLPGPNKNIQDIFYKQTVSTGLRPESAAPITTLYDESPGYLHVRKSPLPPDNEDRSITPTGH